MSTNTIQFIAKTKLGELKNQRRRLLDAYQDLLDACDGKTKLDQLAALYTGLQDVAVGGYKMHPDLQSLDVLLRGPSPSDAILDSWIDRYHTMISHGRMRAEIVYLFGGLLGEWNSEDTSKQSFVEQRQAAHRDLVEHITTADESARSSPKLLVDLIRQIGDIKTKVPAQVQAMAEELIGHDDGCVNLGFATRNPNFSPQLRREAQRFSEDLVLQQEFASALAVATRQHEDWNWPATGVTMRASWTRNKWRLYPQVSLVDLTLINKISGLWFQLYPFYSSTPLKLARAARLAKLENLKAPDVIIQNERRMLDELEERWDLGWYESRDPWTKEEVWNRDSPATGITYHRASEQAHLRDADPTAYYYGDGVNRMVQLVNAEVRTLQAAFPGQPIHIAKLDIRDFFASVPHEVLIAMVEELGIPEAGVDFVRRFLSLPMDDNGGLTHATRGVPMNQPFSHELCEWLMKLMERFVQSDCEVRIVRQVDDVCILAADALALSQAWNRIEEFLQACGLEINEEKSGSICLHGERASDLPDRPVRWGMLELTASGEWQTHEPTFSQFMQDTCRMIHAKPSVLGKVVAWNAYFKFLVFSLGMPMDLGAHHRQAVNDAVLRFDQELFDGESGICGVIEKFIRERFELADEIRDLPASWMFWPITAGGLSLRSANIIAGQFNYAWEERQKKRVEQPEERLEDWQTHDGAWLAFYQDQMESLEPAACSKTDELEQLGQKFIERGKQISGDQQEGLSDYWWWVLSLYGPEILERFGTFEFLLTSLVPLQLIHEKLLTNPSD